MTIYKYDGTIMGIFSCIFESFTSHETPMVITDEDVQLCFGDDIKEIETDEKKYTRALRAFATYAGEGALHDLYYAFRSGEKNKHLVIFDFIRKTLERRANISSDFSCAEVMRFYDLIKRIGTEIHRMKGFVRFSLAVNGVYYTHFSTDNNIVDLLLPHFAARFSSQPFALHDVKRNIIAMYNGKERRVVKLTEPLSVELENSEETFTELWQTYYRKVTINERLNERAMRGYMPVRYHEHLSEKQLKLKIV